LLSEQILSSVGSSTAKLTVDLYDLMLGHESVRDLTYFGIRPSPADVLVAESLLDCANKLGATVTVDEERDERAISRNMITGGKLEADEEDFQALLGALRDHLGDHAMTPDQYVASISNH
jgi:hypothetical protein